MDILQKLDNDSMQLDDYSMATIESLLHTPIVQNNINEVEIDNYLTEKYINNLYGLLHNELGISNNAFYINMRINGYKSSIEYDGRLTLFILDPDITLKIIKAIRDI